MVPHKEKLKNLITLLLNHYLLSLDNLRQNLLRLLKLDHFLLLLGALRRGLLRLWVVLGEKGLGSLALRYDDSVALLDVRLASGQLRSKWRVGDQDP